MKFDNYMGKFASSGDVQTAIDNGDLVKPYVALVEDGNYIDWNTKKADYSKMPLTFEITSGGNIVWKTNNSAYTATIEYQKNGGEWTEITSTADGVVIPVVAGDKVQFRGNNNTFSDGGRINMFSETTCGFEAKGNIMSLLDKTNFATLITLQTAYNFFNLFQNCTGLTDANNLILPATTLTQGCYQGMFQNCTSLVNAPSKLPATTLVYGCYWVMFAGCTSLTTAPELPATTLARYCYNEMFSFCSSLNYIKCLATDISATNSTNNWFYRVSSTGTFVKNASMTSWPTGASGIPNGWTVQEV